MREARLQGAGGRCWAWYLFMTCCMWVGIIHGRHLSLCSLGWRAGRSGGSRLAEASTISHSKDCIWTECVAVHSERATRGATIGLTIFNFIHIEVWARGPRWLHDDSRWWRPSKEKNGRKRGWRICTGDHGARPPKYFSGLERAGNARRCSRPDPRRHISIVRVFLYMLYLATSRSNLAERGQLNPVQKAFQLLIGPARNSRKQETNIRSPGACQSSRLLYY